MSDRTISSLVLTRFRPDQPAGGAALRNWQNIQALSRLGPVDVVSIGDVAHTEPVEVVRHWQAFVPEPIANRLGGLNRWRPTLEGLERTRHPVLDAFHCPAAARWIEARLSSHAYDIVVVEELALALYLRTIVRSGTRVVFDAHNVEADLRREMAAKRKLGHSWRGRLRTRLLGRRLREVERRAVRAADLIWVCSEVDADALRRAYRPSAPITVVPNGVDVAAYRPHHAVRVDADWSDHPLTLMYPGAFSYYPNEEAALCLIKRVLPLVRRRHPEARAVLVGRDPTPAMLAAADNDPGIIVTGTVPSVLPFFEPPCVVTLPITLGSGTRLKILEAFAAARPVISTRKGAEGIAATDGRELFLRNDPGEMAEGAIQLWHSSALRRSLCDNALQLVLTRYSWETAAQRIKASLAAIQSEKPLSVGQLHATAPAPAATPPSSP